MRPFLFVLSLAALLAGVQVLSEPRFLPLALGPALNPWTGIWRSAAAPEAALPKPAGAAGEVRLDRDLVPYLFAERPEDLYFLQGYVTAAHRLWQMDAYARTSLGRMSEVFGARAREADLQALQLAPRQLAEAHWARCRADPVCGPIVQAYTDGANRWVEGLGERDLPPEFKLFAYRPEAWTPQKTMAVGLLLSRDLSGRVLDPAMSGVLAKLSDEEARSLYPTRPSVPAPTTEKAPAAGPDLEPGPAPVFRTSWTGSRPAPGPAAPEGSNVWAVNAAGSRKGAALLASDPHLRLTLPSIWYEAQLSLAGRAFRGGTVPGIPGVLIGFNDRVSWGFTSGRSDAVDVFEVRFSGPDLAATLHGDEARPVERHEDRLAIRFRGAEPVTLLRTARGFVGRDIDRSGDRPRGLAVRWTAQEGGLEMKAIHGLGVSSTAEACTEAARDFASPPVNLLCASRDVLAYRHAGLVPVRRPGEGLGIQDGTGAADPWRGFIPFEALPGEVMAGGAGAIANANQHPAGAAYPYFLGARFSAPYRQLRIQDLLREARVADARTLWDWQGDAANLLAARTLPALLALLDPPSLGGAEREGYERLRSWDRRDDAGSEAPVLFKLWWDHLNRNLWGGLAGDAPELYPAADRTEALLAAGGEGRSLREPVLAAFRKAVEAAGGAGSWGRHKRPRIEHLGRIPAFGRDHAPMSGGPFSVNAHFGGRGTTWRMVAAMTPEPTALVAYPGGQSGNPLSLHYDRFLADWAAGRPRETRLKSLSDLAREGARSPW